jgi:aspartate carbamoyltransferase catalytic subunit
MAEFKHKDIIALRDLTKEEIELLLSTAESMREINSRDIKKVPTLRGKTIINLFYEASTRTRTSFEIAGKSASRPTRSILQLPPVRPQRGKPWPIRP